MSILVKYSTGSTYTLVANKVETGIAQDVTAYHVSLSNINGGVKNGLKLAPMTITGDILDMTACQWDDVVAVSLDSGTSYQTVYFTGATYASDCWSGIYPYSMTLLVSPLRYGATHTSATYWGWTTATVPAATGTGLMRLSYQGPTRFWPLLNSLASVDGVNLTYTGTPIFSNGLVVNLGVKASAPITAKSLLMRLLFSPSSLPPSAWIVGGSAPNILTANQSSAETDLTGMEGINGTLGKTNQPYVGSYCFYITNPTANNAQVRTSTYINVTAGTVYTFSAYVNRDSPAGRHALARIEWFNAASASLGTQDSVPILEPGSYTRFWVSGRAPATATKCKGSIVFTDSVAGDTPYVDGLQLEISSVPDYLYLWQSAHNSCFIDTAAAAVKWFDGTTTISRTIDLAGYIAGGSLDVVAIDDTTDTLVVVQAGTATTATGTLAALTWGTLNIGSDGSANEAMAAISYIANYPYALVSAEYQALHLTANPLLMGTHSIYFRSSGTVTVNNQGRLIDSVGNDVSAGMAGPIPTGVSGSAGTLVMSDGLSARWQVLIDDTWRV